jgi:hypothetical protein
LQRVKAITDLRDWLQSRPAVLVGDEWREPLGALDAYGAAERKLGRLEGREERDAEVARLLGLFTAIKAGLKEMMEHEERFNMLQMAVMVSALSNAAFPLTADDLAWAEQYLGTPVEEA